MREIEDFVFCGCSSLSSISIPFGVKSIGKKSFADCTSLQAINIPSTITWVGENAFYNSGYYNNKENWENDALYIDNYLVSAKACISGHFSIQEGTTFIATDILRGSKITDLIIPKSLTTIGYRCFYGCKELISVTILGTVMTIKGKAFANCTSLKNINMPDNVVDISDDAFDDTAFYENQNNWENGCLYISNHLIKAKKYSDNLEKIFVKTGTISIARYAFAYCDFLEHITIPNSVTTIHENAFARCKSLKKVTIKTGVKKILSEAFRDCVSLVNIDVPKSVTTLGKDVFEGCLSLKK